MPRHGHRPRWVRARRCPRSARSLPIIGAVALWASLAPRATASPDTSIPPPAHEIHRLIEGDWAAACGQLRAALIAAYSPQACESDSFAAWLDLQRWFDLIARNELDEVARLASRHLRWQPAERRIIVSPTGAAPPAENVEPLSNEMLQQTVRDSRFAESALPAIAPRDFKPADHPVGQRIERRRLEGLLADAELGRELFQALRDEDFPPPIVEFLARAREAAPDLFAQFRRLAVAIAVVYDQPPPPNWPHPQVKPEAVPRVHRTPFEIYGFWIQCQQLGRLFLDVRRLEVEQLTHVVDAPVRESEFMWAQAQVTLPRYRFAEAFDLVRYDLDRLRNRAFIWPGGDYSLRSIHAAGGICVDQAYFAMLAGKAKGLPTLFFSGQGPDGGHAWFGFMKRDDAWLLDCGRERNRGEPVGIALDPQTWQPISDHDLKFLASGFRDTAPYRVSRRHIAVARLFAQIGDRRHQLSALENAIAACPQNPEAWDTVTTLLQAKCSETRAPADREALRKHAADAATQFASETDIRVRYQQMLADLARESGDVAEANRITDAIVRENRGDRSDLSAKAAWQPLKHLLDTGDIQRAYPAYRSTVDRLARTGGGNLYFQIVVPFVLTLQDKGETALAEEALLIARKALRPKPLSPLDTHMAQLRDRLRRPDQ